MKGEPMASKKKKKKSKQAPVKRKCSICRKKGHNRRSCEAG